MMYAIEFIRRIDGQAEATALEVVSLVADRIAGVINEAEQLYRSRDTVPRPDGFRIRDNAGDVIHEFSEPQRA